MSSNAPLYQNPDQLLRRLIQFDTTNPPGDEAECIRYIDQLLTDAGIETNILAHTPKRPNLVARLPGRGDAPPLLLYGHVDVVTTANQDWSHPPFAAEIDSGYIWGRGALDMKSGVAMMIAALLRAKAEGLQPPGDIILAVVSDEEDGGDDGAKFLVQEHAAFFEEVRYALGEFGGFSMYIGGNCFYPIMVAEKQFCHLEATIMGPGGHGSMPVRGGAMAKLARFLRQVDRQRLPVHVTPVAEDMFASLASSLGGLTGLVLKGLTNPALADRVIDLLGERGRLFNPLLHNTVSPTIVDAGDKVNVIPSQVSVELDGRLLPGFQPDDLIAELKDIVDLDVSFDVLAYDPGPDQADMSMFDTLAGIMAEADPDGIPIPLLLSGVTDGRFFSQLGIQTYGFTPMQLPRDFNFTPTVHAADERIPVGAVAFGAGAIYKAIQRFG
jgi:acetylornithine deacetylase/succinyl-diaminopimelate desuccinylase-like protein